MTVQFTHPFRIRCQQKPRRMSRHFSLSWCFCQALIVLRLVSLPIRKLFEHQRLLITHLYALKINHTQILPPLLELHNPIAHLLEEPYTTSTLMQRKWSTCFTFSCMSQSRECVHLTSTRSVTQLMVSPQIACHALTLTYVLWMHLNSKCVFLHCYIFLVC